MKSFAHSAVHCSADNNLCIKFELRKACVEHFYQGYRMILHSGTFRWLTFLMTVVLIKALKHKTLSFECMLRRF